MSSPVKEPQYEQVEPFWLVAGFIIAEKSVNVMFVGGVNIVESAVTYNNDFSIHLIV